MITYTTSCVPVELMLPVAVVPVTSVSDCALPLPLCGLESVHNKELRMCKSYHLVVESSTTAIQWYNNFTWSHALI